FKHCLISNPISERRSKSVNGCLTQIAKPCAIGVFASRFDGGPLLRVCNSLCEPQQGRRTYRAIATRCLGKRATSSPIGAKDKRASFDGFHFSNHRESRSRERNVEWFVDVLFAALEARSIAGNGPHAFLEIDLWPFGLHYSLTPHSHEDNKLKASSR